MPSTSGALWFGGRAWALLGLLSGCVSVSPRAPEKANVPSPAVPSTERSVGAAPWERLGDGTLVAVPADRWLFQTPNDGGPSLQLAPNKPEGASALVFYRAVARRGHWFELETLPDPGAPCFPTPFVALRLRLFAQSADVALVSEEVPRCEPGASEVARQDRPPAPASERFVVQGVHATLTANREKGSFADRPDGVCTGCVVEYRANWTRGKRIDPTLYWPDGSEAGVATNDLDVIGLRRDREVATRTCFRMTGAEERPVPTRAGGTAELCVDAHLVGYSDSQGAGLPRPTRLPRFLSRELTPVAALRECLAPLPRSRSLSWVVDHGRVSDVALSASSVDTELPCVRRALGSANWPAGFAWTRIEMTLAEDEPENKATSLPR
jgi:hypothetical protein